MDTLATTRMSSKGQIVIPVTIRKRLYLQPGAQFIVVGEDDVVILKAITTPGMETFDKLIKGSPSTGQTGRAEAQRYCRCGIQSARP